jgi:hypothetical protein
MFFQLSGHWHYKGAGNGRGWELMCLIVLFRGLLVSPELLICYVRRGSFRLAPLGEFGMSTRWSMVILITCSCMICIIF